MGGVTPFTYVMSFQRSIVGAEMTYACVQSHLCSRYTQAYLLSSYTATEPSMSLGSANGCRMPSGPEKLTWGVYPRKNMSYVSLLARNAFACAIPVSTTGSLKWTSSSTISALVQ